MEKIEIRKYFKKRCNNFTLENNTQVLSKKLQNLLKGLNWVEFQKAAIYHPFKSEVSLSALKEDYPHICWLYPQKDQSFSEESYTSPHSIKEIDLFLVPGVAFDHQCRRLGRGAGFYDKVLSQANRALKIGVSWSVQLSLEPLPEEEHDIRMDACVNEKFILYSPHFFEKHKEVQ
ncbi:MAG: 5-formyltetrahydrofolate cyclo-ligase [Bdellovibrionales bacterium]|nr:5-formyltetrahydrofolate cyclo-ligase [Bdellovibrionales bacterium]